jgi:hypothetical protein
MNESVGTMAGLFIVFGWIVRLSLATGLLLVLLVVCVINTIRLIWQAYGPHRAPYRPCGKW